MFVLIATTSERTAITKNKMAVTASPGSPNRDANTKSTAITTIVRRGAKRPVAAGSASSGGCHLDRFMKASLIAVAVEANEPATATKFAKTP
jgi:hypothetical protein